MLALGVSRTVARHASGMFLAAWCDYSAAMKRLYLRLDDDLHERLVAAAETDRRSLNAEITWLLEWSLTERDQQ
jgi:hypothetical protein